MAKVDYDPSQRPSIAERKAAIKQAIEDHAARTHAKREKAQRRINAHIKGPTQFSTSAAVEWGKAKGWIVWGRERYSHLYNRRHDLRLAADVLFDSGNGLVLVQGAGKGERSRHRQRFERYGGTAKANELWVAYYYLEFVRGQVEPVLEERWA